MIVSGIITTILGKTATFTEVAGREKRVHHSKSTPLLLTGERFFFGRDFVRKSQVEIGENPMIRRFSGQLNLLAVVVPHAGKFMPSTAGKPGFRGVGRATRVHWVTGKDKNDTD
jgi:hypothetical protein